MLTISISVFKAKCIALIDTANRTGKPLVVTRRGKPVARVEPLSRRQREPRLGQLGHLIRIRGEIVTTDLSGDWELSE